MQIFWYSRIIQMNCTDYGEIFGKGNVLQDVQLSQRYRTAGCVIVLAKSGRLELGYNILWTL